jgi:hypothetical protein
MDKATNSPPKRRRHGRGLGRQIIVRMHPPMVEQLDRWAAQHGCSWHGMLSRPEAIRRLVAKALTPSPR